MKSISKVGFFVAAVLAAGAAGAQTEGGLEEVVITAQKRVSTLQDVPVAVTAVSGETIENNQIRDAKDLQQLVPSLMLRGYRVAAGVLVAGWKLYRVQGSLLEELLTWICLS